jgi:hypothetical protein
MVRVLATTTNPPSCKGSLFDNEWALRGPPAGREARNSRGTCRRPSRVWDTGSFKLNYSVVLPRARVLATTKVPSSCKGYRFDNGLALRGPPAGREARNSRCLRRGASRVWDTRSFKLNYAVVLPRTRVLSTTKVPSSCKGSRFGNGLALRGRLPGGERAIHDGHVVERVVFGIPEASS